MVGHHADRLATVCPLCSAEEFRPHKLGLLRCRSCGLVLSPTIWLAQANEHLEEEWFGENYQSKTSLWVRLFEEWNNRKTLARLAQAGVRGGRLLDIGVGSGALLAMARHRGFEVVGCDLSPPICEAVRRKHGIAMHCGPLSEIIGAEQFEVVVMNHVLEHVQQPVEFMQEVERLLAPSGIVHIAVPNVSCWEASISGWTSYEPYHLTYFDVQTIKRPIAASGLAGC